MTLPSGTITMGNVKTELGLSGTLTLTDSRVRTLFGVASGTIKLTDGRGKSSFAAPVINSFSVSSTSIIQGNSITLTPSFTANGGASYIGTGGAGSTQVTSAASSGSGYAVSPGSSATYTLTVYNGGGTYVTAAVAVSVTAVSRPTVISTTGTYWGAGLSNASNSLDSSANATYAIVTGTYQTNYIASAAIFSHTMTDTSGTASTVYVVVNCVVGSPTIPTVTISADDGVHSFVVAWDKYNNPIYGTTFVSTELAPTSMNSIQTLSFSLPQALNKNTLHLIVTVAGHSTFTMNIYDTYVI